MDRDTRKRLIINYSQENKNRDNLRENQDSSIAKNTGCSDLLWSAIEINDGIITKALFDATHESCTIAIAAAAVICEEIQNKKVSEAKELISCYIRNLENGEEITAELGALVIFDGIKKLPSRVKCATLYAKAAIEQINKNE